jgi:hypothetical protein
MSSADESPTSMGEMEKTHPSTMPRWRRVFGKKPNRDQEENEDSIYRPKRTLGILSDRETDEVPGKWPGMP